MVNTVRSEDEFVSLAEAAKLIRKMKMYYGVKFTNQWPSISDRELAEEAAELLSKVTLREFEYGLEVMQTKVHVPSLPEFKSWCRECITSLWLTSNEAWGRMLKYENHEPVKITAQAFYAFNQVKHIYENEGQRQGHIAFNEAYERVVEQCVNAGKPQTLYVPPPALKAPEVERPYIATPERKKLARQHINKLMKQCFVKPKTVKTKG